MSLQSKGIVVTTSEYTKDFLRDCLESIKDTEYPVLIVSNGGYKPDDSYWHPDWGLIINDWNGWEMAGVQRGKENFEEFIHIMDTSIIKDITFFDRAFAVEGNVVFTAGNYHYMGKFVSSLLPPLPRVESKDVGIALETRWLPKPYTNFEPDLPVHTHEFTTIHGQYRMVLENENMIKYKGTWSL